MQTGAGQALPIGIDLGNFSCKVAALGRTGTQVLPNSLSNRETPTLVSFGAGRRLVGEAATTQRTSNVAGTVWNIRALLGRVCAIDEHGNAAPALIEQPYSAWQGFQLASTADAGLAMVVEGESLPLESIAAACLGDCITTTSLAVEQGLVPNGVPLVALAAPAWAFTASQRAALANAATIAGINVAEVLSEAGAAALFYATERLPALLRELSSKAEGTDASVDIDEADVGGLGNDEVILLDDCDDEEDGPVDSRSDSPDSAGAVELTSATVVFVDIGHGGTSASLVTFDNSERSIKVLDSVGADIGGREIDVLLAEHFKAVAESAQPGLVLQPNVADRRVLRARQRIFSATDESKKVLSANDSDTAMLEELAEGLDVRCTVTRGELEEMLASSGVLNAMLAPVEQVLQRAATGGIQMDAIELCGLHQPSSQQSTRVRQSSAAVDPITESIFSNRYGGTARVPLLRSRVSALAEEYMETPLIRRSLNGSEAVARGCALYAAMALPTFNEARRIHLIDTTPYDISVVLTAPPPPTASLKGEASKLLSPEAKRENSGSGGGVGAIDKPVLHVGRGSALPSPASGSPSARLRISDVQNGSATLTVSYTDSAQLPAGIMSGKQIRESTVLPIATYRLDIVDSGINRQTDTSGGNANPEDSAVTEKADDAERDSASEIEVGFAIGADLNVTCLHRRGPLCEIVAVRTATPGVMHPEALAAATQAEERMAAEDAAVARAEAARNSLESAIYGYRDEVLTAASEGKLEDDARELMEQALLACEDWLYEEETYDITDAAVFDDKLTQIQSLMDANLRSSSGQADSKGEDSVDDDDIDN